MDAFLGWLKRIFIGADKPPPIEEERYPSDAKGRPDLTRFTKPVAHYTAYIEAHIASLNTKPPPRDDAPPSTHDWQVHAYRKGVLGQWGLIARGPAEALPTVLGLLKHPVAEGRQAGAGVLGVWARDGVDLTAPAMEAAERELASSDADIETLGILLEILGRAKSEAALPLLARVLRAPESKEGDLDWAAVEALGDIAGKKFVREQNAKEAAELWLRERGV